MRRGPSCPVQRRTDRDKAIDRGMIRAAARTRDPAVYVVDLPHDSQTTTTRRGRVVHPAGAGQPPPLRGAARLVRRRADLPAGRRPVRLHPLGDDQPGPRVAGRTAGAVRPHAQARPATGCRASQGPGAGPGDPAAPPGAVHLRDLRAAGRRTHPAQPHQRRRAPRRGGVRPAAAPPPARPQQLPGLVALDLPGLVRRAGYPSTRVIPATCWLLSLLALKLTRTRRVSHVDDLLADPAAGLLAGLGVLPKKSALTSYSYRLSHDHQRALLAALDQNMISAGLATSEQAIFDLDFHAVLHWGDDPVLEKHYVPKRSQRARSVLTFFAQDSGTHNLVYAGADLAKATQAREVIAFCDHWKAVSGADPHLLVMDQRLTTQQVLGELDARGVKFLTLRMRSPTLLRYINGLTPADYTTITLDRPGTHSRPGVHESAAVRLTSYPGTLRQLIVTGLGHDAPTVIITNDHDLATKAIIGRYARRMTIEQRLAEIIRAFHTDALSSTVNLNIDLDVMLAVLAQALLAALRERLPGYHAATPDTLQRRFLETPGTIINHGDTITVRLERRAYSPVLRKANLPAHTTIPWWGNRTLRYELA